MSMEELHHGVVKVMYCILTNKNNQGLTQMTYYIVAMKDSEWEALASYDSYSEADLEHEDYCNKYPNAWIEIVSKADYMEADQCK